MKSSYILNSLLIQKMTVHVKRKLVKERSEDLALS